MSDFALDQIKLHQAPRSVKWFLTMFLLMAMLGYLMAVLNIWTQMEGIKETTTPEGKKETKITLWLANNIVNHFRGAEKEEDKAAYPGMDLPTLTSTTHTHLLGMSLLAFALGLIFIFTSVPFWLKTTVWVGSFVAIVLDLGSSWLVKYVTPAGAHLMIVAGFLVGICFFVETVIPLYEFWIKKKPVA